MFLNCNKMVEEKLYYAIGHIALDELVFFLREQAQDSFPSLRDENYLETLAEKWSQNAKFCVCRKSDNTPVGMIAFYANQLETGTAYIPHVYVRPEFRNHGLFSSMFNLVSQYVKDHGFTNIRLEVAKENERARRAYLKSGFREECHASKESVYLTKSL